MRKTLRLRSGHALRLGLRLALPFALAFSIACSTDGGGSGNPVPDGSVPPPDMMWGPTPHAGWPSIMSSDNQVLSPMTLVSIVGSNDAIGSKFLDFGDELVKSQWFSAVGQQYGLATPKQHVRVTGPAITSDMSGNQMEAYIRSLITAGMAPQPDGNTMYMLYLPDTINAVDQSGTNTDCQLYEGYHLPFGGGNDNWAFAQRCFGNTQQGIDDATNTGSHEIIESATDPTGNGWSLGYPSSVPWNDSVWVMEGYGANAENADLCVGAVIYEGGFQFARVWSTMAGTTMGDPCIPTVSDPYYNVSPNKGWTPVAAGASVTIPLTGWSTAPVGDFWIDYGEIDSSGGTWRYTITGPRSFPYNGGRYPALNNGETATLKITPPAGASSGDYLVLELYTSAENAGPMADQYHIEPVGAYIP